MRKNNKGITLIALIVTIIVLIVIAGVSIATLTADNGVLRQTNSAKVLQIEGTAREQVDLACAAMRLAISQASAQDNSYSAKANASAIQSKLLEIIKADSTMLESDKWSAGTLDAEAGSFAITYSGDDYKNACNDTNAVIKYTIGLSQKSIEVIGEENSILKDQSGNDVELNIGTNTETFDSVSTADTYVGYYANLDEDEEPEGIIYADLAIGGSGQWGDSDGAYSYDAITGTKDYYISKEDHEGPFGTKDVLTVAPNSDGKDRFYVMALEDFTTADYNTFYWYYSAYNNKISDYSSITSTKFGTGKSNTANMIAAWNATTYGNKDARDMWGVIQEEVKNGWFVPSRGEWGAFASNLGITLSNYSSLGLSTSCWSSSLGNTYAAWDASFNYGYINGYYLYTTYCVRLSTTF